MIKGKIVINFDETPIESTNSRPNFSWSRRGQLPGRTFKKKFRHLSMFLAVTTDGALFW
jgi:hypothetical protein